MEVAVVIALFGLSFYFAAVAVETRASVVAAIPMAVLSFGLFFYFAAVVAVVWVKSVAVVAVALAAKNYMEMKNPFGNGRGRVSMIE